MMKSDIPMNDQLRFQRRRPHFVIVWASVISTGENTHFISIDEGVKLNQSVYLDFLKEESVVPWINAAFGEIKITLQ